MNRNLVVVLMVVIVVSHREVGFEVFVLGHDLIVF